MCFVFTEEAKEQARLKQKEEQQGQPLPLPPNQPTPPPQMPVPQHQYQNPFEHIYSGIVELVMLDLSVSILLCIKQPPVMTIKCEKNHLKEIIVSLNRINSTVHFI